MRRISAACLAVAALATNSAAGQVVEYALVKQPFLVQDSESAPATPVSWIGYALFWGTNIGFDTADVDRPGSLSSLALTTDNWYWSQAYSTKAELDENLPPGPYAFTGYVGGSPLDSGVLTLGTDFFPGVMPMLAAGAYAELDGMDPSKGLIVPINGFTPHVDAMWSAIALGVIRANPWSGVYSAGYRPDEQFVALPAGLLFPETDYILAIGYDSRRWTVDAGFAGATATVICNPLLYVEFRTGKASCAPDLNLDGVVDQADLAGLLGEYGCSALPGGCAGDVDGDGLTDQVDLAALLSQYGEACP